MRNTIEVTFQNQNHKEILENINQDQVTVLLNDLEGEIEDINLEFILKHLAMLAMESALIASRNKISQFESKLGLSLSDTQLFKLNEYDFEGNIEITNNNEVFIDYKGSADELLLLSLLGTFEELESELYEQFGSAFGYASFNGVNIESMNL